VPLRHCQESSEYNKGQFHCRLRHEIRSRIYAHVIGRLSTSSTFCRVGDHKAGEKHDDDNKYYRRQQGTGPYRDQGRFHRSRSNRSRSPVQRHLGGIGEGIKPAANLLSSTENGALIAGVTWQNGFGGQAGSVADRVMRKGLAQAATEIANELAGRIRPASFFCPLLYGRTYFAGISRASWPSACSLRLR
jgi:hypothetical protein